MGFRRKGIYEMLGVADILLLLDGRFIAIEVKTRVGKLSDNQKLFGQQVVKNGGTYLVVRSLEEFKQYWAYHHESNSKSA